MRIRKRNGEAPRHVIQLKADSPSPLTPPDDGDHSSDTTMSHEDEQVDEVMEQASSESSERELGVRFSEPNKSAVKDPRGIPLTTSKEPEGKCAQELSRSSRRTRFGRTTCVKTGVSLITAEGADHFSPSLVRDEKSIQSGYYDMEEPRPKLRPAAKNSAFSGPVRYDWMDIVSQFTFNAQSNRSKSNIFRG